MPQATNQRLADKIIFSECHRQHSLPNLLTKGTDTMIEAYDGKKQTAADAPVVMVNDLAKTHGNNVSVTIIHNLSQKPSMGIKKRDGYEESITEANFELRIDQYHHSVKTPLMMEQQKVGYNKMELGRPLLTTYHGDLTDEVCLIHLAGARGTYDEVDRIVPLETDADFAEIMVNPVTPPTFDRKGYCGGAESIDGTGGLTAMDANDIFTVTDCRKFKEAFETMPNPPKPVSLGSTIDKMGTDPLYLGLITPKMWTTYEQNSTEFQTQVSNALKATSGFNHPLFKGDMFLKDNILWKKYTKVIGWQPGDTIKVCGADDAASVHDETVPAGFNVERGIILGGQALAMAYGSVLPGGMANFLMDGEKFDQNAWWRQWMDWIMGLAKIRFKDKRGRLNDYGVFAFDAAVPL